jgi:2-haloacid dehalogenase
MPRAFVFDAYGTLFDVHAAINRHRAAAGPDADRFSEIWRTKQLEYSWTLTLAGRYLDFWTLTARALDFAFARFPSVDRALRPKLLEAYWTLESFSDARPALRELRAHGASTAILSNGSPEMLTAAIDSAGIGAELDAALSVDAIRIYKPRPEAYALVTEKFNLKPHGLCLVQPLGCDGCRHLRFSDRVDQPHEQRGRIRTCPWRGPYRTQRPHDVPVNGRVGSNVRLPQVSSALEKRGGLRIDGAAGSA